MNHNMISRTHFSFLSRSASQSGISPFQVILISPLLSKTRLILIIISSNKMGCVQLPLTVMGWIHMYRMHQLHIDDGERGFVCYKWVCPPGLTNWALVLGLDGKLVGLYCWTLVTFLILDEQGNNNLVCNYLHPWAA